MAVIGQVSNFSNFLPFRFSLLSTALDSKSQGFDSQPDVQELAFFATGPH